MHKTFTLERRDFLDFLDNRWTVVEHDNLRAALKDSRSRSSLSRMFELLGGNIAHSAKEMPSIARLRMKTGF